MAVFCNNPYGPEDFHEEQLAYYGLKISQPREQSGKRSYDVEYGYAPLSQPQNNVSCMHPAFETTGCREQTSSGAEIIAEPQQALQTPPPAYQDIDRFAPIQPDFDSIAAIPRPACRPRLRPTGRRRIGERAIAPAAPPPPAYDRALHGITPLLQHQQFVVTGAGEQHHFSHGGKRRPSEVDIERQFKRLKIDEAQSGPGLRKAIKKHARAVAEIVMADASGREAYAKDQHFYRQEKVEAYRRQHPLERPDYQKQFILEQSMKLCSDPEHARISSITDYDLLVADEERSKSSPASAPCRDSIFSLSVEERHRARLGQQRLQSTRLTRLERAAFSVSKTLDVFKQKPKQDDDGMDWFDQAPEAELETCAHCRKPTHTYLIRGLCQSCQSAARRRR